MNKEMTIHTGEDGLKLYITEPVTENYRMWLDHRKSGEEYIAKQLLLKAINENETWALLFYLSTEHPDYSRNVDVTILDH